MCTTVSLLKLVLVTASLPGPGGAALTPNQSCPADITVSGANVEAMIPSMNLINKEKYLYVHPEEGFRGVNIVVGGDNLWEMAWFPFNSTCFLQRGLWWKVKAKVSWKWVQSNGWKRTLTFELRAGECAMKCVKTGDFPVPKIFLIFAHGPSMWRYDDPSPCTTYSYTTGNVDVKNCSEPPVITRTATTPTSTARISKELLIIIVLGATLFVVVVAWVVVEVRRCIKQRTMPQEEPTSPGSMALRENIYEDIGRPQPQAGSGTVHEIVNDIYEPFSRNTDEDSHPPQVPEGSGAEHEIQNDIYEPFSYGHSAQGTTGVNEHKEFDDTYDRLDFQGGWDGKQ